MSDLKYGFPNLAVDPSEPVSGLRLLIVNLLEFAKRIVTAVNSKQDKDEELNIKYYNQNDEPTLSANENAAFWKDADGGPVYYLVLKTDGGSQVKVQLS